MECLGNRLTLNEREFMNCGIGIQESKIASCTMKESDLYQKLLMNHGILSEAHKLTPTTVNNKNVAFVLKQREISHCGFMKKHVFSQATCSQLASVYIPNRVEQEIKFGDRVFCGNYSLDGNIFVSCCHDQHIRIYNTNTMLTNIIPIKDVIAEDVGFNILDATIRSDSKYVAYSSWSNCIHLCPIFKEEASDSLKHIALNLRPNQEYITVFCLQFARNGNEILCGANDGCLYIYDIKWNDRTLKVSAHDDDVNTVCFADDSSQVFYSGGDDGLVNVWDHRIISDTAASPVGTFAGHKDGITFIDTLGDARYLLSNSKDQSIKLWDTRKFSSSDAIQQVRNIVSQQTWDYRWETGPREHPPDISGDTSMMTYRGHKVLSTLIRARFSPLHSTGNKYIYCGCGSGKVFIYDVLSGKSVAEYQGHTDCIRDVAWHPFKPEIISSSCDGSIKLWQWNSDGVV